MDDAAVDEGHDVEGGAEDGGVLAEGVRAGDGDGGVLEGGDDAVLAFDFVRGLREEFAGGFFAQDVAGFVGGGELVGWVGLAEAELGFVVS